MIRRVESPSRPLWRSVLMGGAVLAANVLACALMTQFGWWMPAAFVAVFGGFAMMASAQDDMVSVFGGLFLGSAAGFLAIGFTEAPLAGWAVSGIPVAEAPRHRGAAVFRFTDGRVLADNAGAFLVYGRAGRQRTPLYRQRLAPIVGDGWTPSMPVTAWAISDIPNSLMPRSDWSRPSRGGLRAISINNDDIRNTIVDIGRRYGLSSHPNAPVLHWYDDPGAAMAAQWQLLLKLVAGCLLLWILLLVAGRTVSLIRGRSLTSH